MNQTNKTASNTSWNMMKSTWINAYNDKKITTSKLLFLILKNAYITDEVMTTMQELGISKDIVDNLTYAYNKLDDSLKNDNEFIEINDAMLQDFTKYFIDSPVKVEDKKIILPTNIDENKEYLDSDISDIYENLTNTQKKILEKFIDADFKYSKGKLTLNQKNILKKIDEEFIIKLETISKKLIEENRYISIDTLPIVDDKLANKIFALIMFVMEKDNLKYDTNTKLIINNNALDCKEIIERIDNFFIENKFKDISKDEFLKLIPYAKDAIFSTLLKNKFYKTTNADKYNIHLDNDIKFDDEVKEKHLELKDVTLKAYNNILENMLKKVNFTEIAKLEQSKKATIEARFKGSFIPSYFELLPINIFRYIRLKINKEHILYIEELPFNDIELSKIIATFVIQSVRSISKYRYYFDFYYDEMLGGLVLNKEYSYRNMLNELVSNATDGAVFEYGEINQYIKRLTKNSQIENLKSIMIQNNDLIQVETNPNRYILKEHFKTIQRKVELIYLLEPNGYKNDKLNLAQIKLNNLFTKVDDDFEELSIKQIESALDQVQNIHFWGWHGYYMHKKHIQEKFKYLNLDEVVEFIHNSLEDITQISLNKYFEKNKSYFERNGIYTEYSLHTLLKTRYSGEFQFNDSPWVARYDSKKRASLVDNILEIMNENRVYTLNELTQKTHQDEQQLMFIVARAEEIINFGVNYYIKKEFINELISIDNIVKYIDENIDNDKLYYFDYIEDRFEDELHNLDVKYSTHHNDYSKKHIVLDLLRKYNLNDNSNKYKITDNNRIVSKTLFKKTQDLGYHHILKNHFFDKVKEVNIEEVKAFFNKRGFKDFMNSYVIVKDTLNSKNKLVVRKDKDTLILIEALGILDSEIVELNTTIKEYSKTTTNFEAILEMLTSQNKLPQISEQWNKYMLYDFLSYEDFVKSPVLPMDIEVKMV